jgi:hypothetical protein
MACETDLYFRVRDNDLDVEMIPNAELRVILSVCRHVAALGVNSRDTEFIHTALNKLLGS